jgi:hypothetical protein
MVAHIENDLKVVYLHTITKTWQIGCLLGVIGGTVFAILRRNFALQSFGRFPVSHNLFGKRWIYLFARREEDFDFVESFQ